MTGDAWRRLMMMMIMLIRIIRKKDNNNNTIRYASHKCKQEWSHFHTRTMLPRMKRAWVLKLRNPTTSLRNTSEETTLMVMDRTRGHCHSSHRIVKRGYWGGTQGCNCPSLPSSHQAASLSSRIYRVACLPVFLLAYLLVCLSVYLLASSCGGGSGGSGRWGWKLQVTILCSRLFLSYSDESNFLPAYLFICMSACLCGDGGRGEGGEGEVKS